ncbi:MAG TPA: hypothetical protein VLV78_18150 [Thermoanaerobaculia bacterium]|nr:hypothetical protein [Thermoanaerobaculia bacterium]
MFETRQPLVRILLLLAVTLLLGWAGTASAQNVTTSAEGLQVHGFINATAFLQNQNFTFGNGQNAEFPNPPETKTDRWFLDGDVRNTRVTFAFTGPKLENDTKVGATLEADFFGGFNGTGGFSNAQATPRIRHAYVDLVRGRNTFRLGQAFAPLFGNVPVSYSHIAFPLGYGATGYVGWRFPGIFLIHDLTPTGSATTSKFTLAVLRNTWAGPGDNVNSGSAGPASTLPQVEGRFDWGAKTWSTYVVGHVDKKDLSGAGVKSSNDSLTGWAAEAGAKVTKGPFMLQGNAYTGKAIGQQFGQISQFGDIKSWGFWLQGGYNFSKRWSGYLFAGMEKPNKDDVIRAKQTRIQDQMGVASLMYNLGPYGFNVEWLHNRLTTGANEVKTSGDQLAASVIYKF